MPRTSKLPPRVSHPVPQPRRGRRAALPGLAGAAVALALLLPAPPVAQTGLPGLGGNRQMSNDPVTFTAEEVEFDQNSDVVTARGRVEAWQGDRVLRADLFTYNRTTGVATAEGNVVLIEPDGQALFADRAELQGGMRDAAIEGLRGLLTSNARLAAAGARRTDGRITDLSRVVYSSCDLCPEDPTRPPLWQLRARIASLHSDEQRVRYRDASVQFWGWPLLYTPYLSHASPDAPRASGFLSPSFGITRFLGGFAEIPYYWAIDGSSDLLITPTISTRQYGNLGLAYRRRFNTGTLALEGSVGYLREGTEDTGVGGHILSRAIFGLDENWRAGFGINRASSRDYMRAYRYGAPRVLTSNAFVEGFWGTEAYARLDARYYQGLSITDVTGQIPLVLPVGYAEYAFPRDSLGGYFSVDTQAYNIYRSAGTSTQRLGTRASYELPYTGVIGDVWTFRSEANLLGGFVQDFVQDIERSPNPRPAGENGAFTHGNIRAALDWRWPLVRSAGEWGNQLIEPRVQFVTGPRTGNQLRFPNEDSLDLEFTDANLFALNRWPGRDRQEGGSRVDAAFRAAWMFPNGGRVEGLAGRSYRLEDETAFPTGSGLERRASDWVGRVRVAPVPWFELTGRGRLDSQTSEPNFWDLTGTVSIGRSSFNVGYLRAPPVPGLTNQREEISAGAFLRLNNNWRVGMFGRYDLREDRPVSANVVAAYEDECTIFEARFFRRFAEDPVTQRQFASNTILLFRVTLKTVGDFGIRAL